MIIVLSILVFVMLALHIRQSNINDCRKKSFDKLKEEVDKLRIEKLKFKKGDYVEYNNVKCYILELNVDRYTYDSFDERIQAPYKIAGPDICKFVCENQIKLLKCKKDK